MTQKNKSPIIFHAGLNKSGSSFLQELFQHNFSNHSNNLLYYPKPHLSCGNATAFSHAIRDLDYNKAFSSLRNLLNQATIGETVILSTEFMYHQFVKPEQRNLLYSCFSEIGYTNLTFVFVFRNVFEHAISAYCHRCGILPMPRFDEWIVDSQQTATGFHVGVTCYEFWSDLRLLLSAAKDKRFKIRFFPYSSKMTANWESFLGVDLCLPSINKVNVSVTPSEAEALRCLRNRNKFSMGILRQHFKEIEFNDKADDSKLKGYYHSLIISEIAKHKKTLNLAESNIGFSISSPPSNISLVTSPILRFTEQQLVVLFRYMNAKPRFLLRHRFKSMLPKILIKLVRRAF